MIGHVSEVWLALFAAFAVGSVLGWLVYRWVDRSDYAFDQRELTNALGRRFRGEQTAVAPTEQLEQPRPEPAARPAGREVIARPKARSRTAEKFRARVRSSNVAAAWRAARDQRSGKEPEAATEPKRVDRSPPLTSPRLSPPKQSGVKGRRGGDESRSTESEPWPVRGAAWPTGGDRAPAPALLPPPTRSGNGSAHLFGKAPVHDEIWPDDDASAGDKAAPAKRPEKAAPSADKPTAKPMPASAAAAGRPPGLASPPGEPDDLKLIKGVGPAFEHKLNQLGIYCYRQIAAWTPAQRDWIGQELGAARIEKDRWIEQAAALAIGNKPPGDNGN